MLRKIFFSFALIVLMQAGNVAFAQQFEFSSSLNPVGSGARATGMGGAFIGVADDATAASWNPAGLIQLERPEVSVVLANFSREQTYKTSKPEVNTTNTMGDSGINYLSAVFKPMVLFGRNVVVSVNYQRLYEMSKKTSFKYDIPSFATFDINMEQNGYLYALSPAFAVQINPKFSVGATLNLWKDYLGSNGWSQLVHQSSASLAYDAYEQTLVAFDGINMNLGFLWNASSNITVGGVLKTPFDAKLNVSKMTVASNSAIPSQAEFSETNETMSMPMSYGLGVQYRPSDAVVLALDVYQTKWSDFWLKHAGGNKTNPLDGTTSTLSDTTQVRLGAEYLMIRTGGTIALRGGLFSDPEPAAGKVDAYRGFSLGAGYSTKQYSLDASYQYRTGNDVTSDIPAIPDSKMDVTQQTIMASVIIYF
jgi:long-subunit fatty acid transport protein